MKKIVLFLLLLIFIAACGTGFSGTYSDSMKISTYKFQSNGKVEITGFGVQTESNYEKDGDKIKINGAATGSSLVFTIQSDGSLTNGALTLTKY